MNGIYVYDQTRTDFISGEVKVSTTEERNVKYFHIPYEKDSKIKITFYSRFKPKEGSIQISDTDNDFTSCTIEETGQENTYECEVEYVVERPTTSVDADVFPFYFKIKTQDNNFVWVYSNNDLFITIPEASQGTTQQTTEGAIIYPENRVKSGRKLDISWSEGTLTIIVDGVNAGNSIGQRMSGGEIIINGNAGSYLGQEMTGGEIQVNGNAKSFVGKGMTDGYINVKGDAEDFVGWEMNGEDAEITIHGEAGQWLGIDMKQGKIVALKNTKKGLGWGMKDGFVVVYGNYIDKSSDIGVGKDMDGGKITVKGNCEKISLNFQGGTIECGSCSDEASTINSIINGIKATDKTATIICGDKTYST